MKDKEFWEDHLNHLIDLRDEISLDKITILTGGNGKGKSLIRKQVLGICQRDGVRSWSVSMDDRAGVDGSRMMVFTRDCEWLPTSINTFDSIQRFYESENTFGIFDEIEIGMSEESQLGVALYINKHLEEFRKNNRGLLIITHSKHLVRNINADVFLNIEGMSRDEWLNREIIPTDFEELDKDSSALFREVQRRLSGRK